MRPQLERQTCTAAGVVVRDQVWQKKEINQVFQLFVGEDAFHRDLTLLQEEVIVLAGFVNLGVLDQGNASRELARNAVGSYAMVDG